LYTRLKVAAAFAVLDEHLHDHGVTAEDWELAGHVMAVSDATRADVQTALASAADSRNTARGRAEGQRELAKVEVVQAAEIARASRGVQRYLAKHPGQWCKGGPVRASLDKPLREHFRAALDALVAAGQVEVEAVENNGNPGVQIRGRA
jgi:hypothetical protein